MFGALYMYISDLLLKVQISWFLKLPWVHFKRFTMYFFLRKGCCSEWLCRQQTKIVYSTPSKCVDIKRKLSNGKVFLWYHLEPPKNYTKSMFWKSNFILGMPKTFLTWFSRWNSVVKSCFWATQKVFELPKWNWISKILIGNSDQWIFVGMLPKERSFWTKSWTS